MQSEHNLIEDFGIPCGDEHPCPYLEGTKARERAFYAERLPSELYYSLMDTGWRRSGNIVYKPACESCQECKPIRIPVDQFRPNRVQRRILKRNTDLEISIDEPKPSEEKFDLFMRYQHQRHEGSMCTFRHEFIGFLYTSPVRTCEMEVMLDNRLVAVAILDRSNRFVSAVYTYFDPEFAERSLGTWAILRSIQYAREFKIPYYYMGYYIEHSRKMNYKTNFRPCEIGDSHGKWSRIER